MTSLEAAIHLAKAEFALDDQDELHLYRATKLYVLKELE